MRPGTKMLAITLLLCATAFSQSGSPRTSLELGSVDVWLGMPKQEVLAKFASAGFKVINTTEVGLMVLDDDKQTYNVDFRGGRLSFASRSWNGKNTDNITAVIEALAAISGRNGSFCRVYREPSSSPSTSLNRIFVTCGQRSVVVGKGKINGINVEIVEERIGDATMRP
jgi:hypothetical protein